MKYREKLGYIALGGALMLVGILAVGLYSPLGAQSKIQMDGHFGTIFCTHLKVIDTGGKAMVDLGVDEDGGFVTVRGKDGGGSVGMTIDEDGGLVVVGGKDGVKAAQMAILGNGGSVSVHGKGNTDARAAMGVNEYGTGMINTWDKNGYRLK